MRRLVVRQNQISYAGLFSRPALSFLGSGGKIIDGLLAAYKDQNVNLGSFRLEQASPDPTAHSVNLAFSPSCVYQFKLDRVESVVSNFRREDYEMFPRILSQGAEWLRSAIPEFSFQSHLFTYFGHNGLSDGTSQDVLAQLPSISIPEIGVSEGNGVIFHWRIPDRDWKAQLLIDHSLSVPGGLFVQFLLFGVGDQIDYSATATTGRSIMEVALRKIGLEIDDAS